MRVEFLSKFNKDLDGIHIPFVRKAILEAIIDVENAKSIYAVRNIKKMSGFKNCYRIRTGDYRIGLFYEKGIVQFARVVHRKDIYKVFP